jgi:hypothetical protein
MSEKKIFRVGPSSKAQYTVGTDNGLHFKKELIYLQEKIDSLKEDQLHIFQEMDLESILQVCIPTGAGKGYIMMVDLLKQIVATESNIFTIASHRLLLNTQHMDDIFKMLIPVIGKVGFVFIGSTPFSTSNYKKNADYNKLLLDVGLSWEDIINSTSSGKEISEIVKKHFSEGRKVVFFTTYHSMGSLSNVDIDTLYCDEAHTLASEAKKSNFRENYKKIKAKKRLFFTATPKDCVDSDEAFLMNNEEVFGRRTGLTFRHCVERGYIVQPVVHIAMPKFIDYTNDLKSVENMTKFIVDSFDAHCKFIVSKSTTPSRIAPKMLVKCSGVDEMWDIFYALRGTLPGVRVCAGATRNNLSKFKYIIDDLGIKDKKDYLDNIQNFGEDEMAIVLHYDTMSEGINVSGFTATMFAAETLSTLPKILQNTGRSTRLHKADRDRLENGEISTSDYSKWIKPYCAVIIPYWDETSESTAKHLAKTIKDLRDQFDFSGVYEVSLGSDTATGGGEDDMSALNQPDISVIKKKLVDEIEHEIDELDKLDKLVEENIKINQMSAEDWFKFANDL